MTTYAFAGSALADRQLRCISEAFDQVTTRVLEGAGIGPGWQCLEIGAGNGSVASILAELSAPGGQVHATDIDLGHLDETDGVRVQRHDIARDPLPTAAYDLIHARHVLVHLPDRQKTVERLTRALRPGGLLVTEDYDVSGPPPVLATPDPETADLVSLVWRGMQQAFGDAGADLAWARHACAAFRAAGLAEVSARTVAWSCEYGGPGRDIVPIAAEQLSERMIRSALVTADQLHRFLALLQDRRTVLATPLFISTLGRRPPS